MNPTSHLILERSRSVRSDYPVNVGIVAMRDELDRNHDPSFPKVLRSKGLCVKNSIVDGQTLRDVWSVLNDPGVRVHVHAIHAARLDLLQCPARHACTLVDDHQLHAKTLCCPTDSLTHLIDQPKTVAAEPSHAGDVANHLRRKYPAHQPRPRDARRDVAQFASEAALLPRHCSPTKRIRRDPARTAAWAVIILASRVPVRPPLHSAQLSPPSGGYRQEVALSVVLQQWVPANIWLPSHASYLAEFVTVTL